MSCRTVPVFQRVIYSVLLAGCCVPAVQAAVAGCGQLPALPGVFEVEQGGQTEVHSPVAITRVAVGEPKIADVREAGDNGVLLTGVAPGTTSLMLWTGCSTAPRQAMVFVRGAATAGMDPRNGPPSVDPGLPSQVQTDIRFVEISRTKLKEASTSIFGKGSNFLFGSPSTVSGTVAPGAIGDVAGAATLASGTFNIAFGGGKVLGVINALESSGFAYTLARPTLVALTGQSASFLAGGEVPIPVPSAGSNNISIEYKEFGIRLTLTPTVVSGDRISLKVAPEVSELDYSGGITIAGTTVPALNVRRTDTSVSLADGESFVISGLISNKTVSAVDKFPGLGDIPILGAFFRNSALTREEKELLMVVTPHLVRPLAADAKLPSLPGEKMRNYDPNFYRMYFLENGNYDRMSGLSQ
ncbi:MULTISPECIES: type II and III secretion system protein family protein [Pseudomonas]|uniref:Type II and III secretion system protein family protein n=1 Tax=Pseudomonas eucalypticola TaxID=2599595 RepID=A0A7D5D4H3_9PSED|nr:MULTISPECIES: type II and III secretion system protein family protein [Pseudomonas]QKZ02874.1 type II and III secretion system protein family protein [Pseudomonas eucalypticola]WAH58187.1 type II and III secretion system protein family protein [Pseudomonas silvicola]